ncbi:Hypothetical predicted protein [Cloeon dipterum]|uniref:Uncharacterized protein n=1 Tax=Cloeon dipterum TaxID=197152 RepID=A0A8S1CSP6_9INSE|nr:Hypothetical predicted protein [Cloeon dipterum]
MLFECISDPIDLSRNITCPVLSNQNRRSILKKTRFRSRRIIQPPNIARILTQHEPNNLVKDTRFEDENLRRAHVLSIVFSDSADLERAETAQWATYFLAVTRAVMIQV